MLLYASFQCRYTLKYTYPYAYYMTGDKKQLVREPAVLFVPYTVLLFFLQFEYQQAQLELEIENLSWKVERAQQTDVAVSSSLSFSVLLWVSFSLF